VSADPFGRIKEIVNLQSNCHVDVVGVSCATPLPGVYVHTYVETAPYLKNRT